MTCCLLLLQNDVLFVDNTMHGGVPGVWRAWLLDEHGNKLQCGTVPSANRSVRHRAQRKQVSAPPCPAQTGQCGTYAFLIMICSV